MPELPEVEMVKRGLAEALEGARILDVRANRPDLRFPLPADFRRRLAGRTVRALSRRAKYILAGLDNGDALIAHLGMTGSFRIERGPQADTPGKFRFPRSPAKAHDHVAIAAEDAHGRFLVVYNDPRRFGFLDIVAEKDIAGHPRFSALGIEPLGEGFGGQALASLFAGKSAPLKAALLDQRLVAGIGNIYACEALWQARLSPRRAAASIATAKGKAKPAAGRLARAIRDVLGRAIAAGGSSLRDYRQTNGEPGQFQQDFAVYGREGLACRAAGCGGAIRRFVQSGRSTFFCPRCQR